MDVMVESDENQRERATKNDSFEGENDSVDRRERGRRL